MTWKNKKNESVAETGFEDPEDGVAGDGGNSVEDDSSSKFPQHWIGFRAVIAGAGILIALFGGAAIFMGVKGIVGDNGNLSDVGEAYASLQSNYGFFAGIYCGLGLAFVFVAIRFKRAQVLLWLCGIMFAGGIARLISMALWGAPSPVFIVLIIAELAFLVATLVWYLWIARIGKVPAAFEART